MSGVFDAAERGAVVEEWRLRQAAWTPKDSRGTGCLVALIGAILLLALARGGNPQWPQALRLALGLGFFAMTAAGFLLMSIRRIPYDPDELIEASIATLGGASTDAAARRQAAVALLFHYEDVQGPTSRTLFDAAQVRQRLGDDIGYVESVERVLREEKLCGAVFLPG